MADHDEYSSSDINWLRGPHVEGEAGAWTSKWVLRLRALDEAQAPPFGRLSGLRGALAEASIRLTGGEDGTVLLELQSSPHPLEPDGFPLVDQLFWGLDAALGGIAEIDGSPRDQWRTFRSGEDQ